MTLKGDSIVPKGHHIHRFWTAEESARALELHRSGMSTEKIAGELGTGRTRAAVMNHLMNTLHVPKKGRGGHNNPKAMNSEPPAEPQLPKLRTGNNPLTGDSLVALGVCREVAVAAPAPLLGPTPKCAFPLWGYSERPNHRFCDEPSVEGRSWCRTHLKACVDFARSVPPKPKELARG